MHPAAILKKILAPLLLLGMFVSQYFYVSVRASAPEIPLFVLPPRVLKAIDLGLHSSAAAFLWLNVVQQIGGLKGSYPQFPEDIRTINSLDPKFSYPYAFATLTLPIFEKTADAVDIGKKGVESSEPDWRVPYYLGITYHLELKDRENAAKYLDIAARTPSAPENIKTVALNYGTARQDQREQTRQIWQSIYETSNDEIIKERASAYLEHLEILDILEKAVGVYKNRFGVLPEKLEDLVSAKILKEVPRSPFGPEYYIENGTIKVRQ